MSQGRGVLTERVKKRSEELFGYELNVKQLRMLPYIQYVMTNNQVLDRKHYNAEEGEAIKRWEDKGYITRDGNKIKVTKEFWGIMCELIFLSYVDLG